MKKRILFLSLALAVLLAWGSVFLVATAGKTYVADGVRQNSLVYIKDVTFVGREVRYTVVNRSRRAVELVGKPLTQRREPSGWQLYDLWVERGENVTRLGAFSEIQLSFTVDAVQERYKGEYRLIFGDAHIREATENSERRVAFAEDGVCILGYLKLKPQADSFGEITVTEEGIRQSSLFTATAVYETDLGGLVKCCVSNRTEADITVQRRPAVEKRINGIWQPFPLYGGTERGSTTVRAGSDAWISFGVATGVELPGEYRIIFGRWTDSYIDEAGQTHYMHRETPQELYAIAYLTIP